MLAIFTELEYSHIHIDLILGDGHAPKLAHADDPVSTDVNAPFLLGGIVRHRRRRRGARRRTTSGAGRRVHDEPQSLELAQLMVDSVADALAGLVGDPAWMHGAQDREEALDTERFDYAGRGAGACRGKDRFCDACFAWGSGPRRARWLGLLSGRRVL